MHYKRMLKSFVRGGMLLVENTSSGKCTKIRSDIETFSCLLLAHQFFALPLESIDPIDYRYTREDVISSSPKLYPTKTAHHVSVSRNGWAG